MTDASLRPVIMMAIIMTAVIVIETVVFPVPATVVIIMIISMPAAMMAPIVAAMAVVHMAVAPVPIIVATIAPIVVYVLKITADHNSVVATMTLPIVAL